jgi:NADPH2:quinone reductase
MKAVLVEAFGPIENVRVRTVAEPVPGKGEVCVAVKAVETNYPDLLVIEGAYQVKPPLPFSPGKAAAGIVETVGDGVTELQPGDRVSVEVEYGAYAEKLTAPAVNCYPLTDDISFEHAAALGLAYQTSHFALVDRCQLQPGETALVLGASGGVGLAAVQLAKALGAGKVIAGTRGAAAVSLLEQSGADAVIDLSMDNLRDGLRDRIHALTEGKGVDVVVDPVGGDAHMAALRAMAWRGRMAIIGFASGVMPAIKANYLLVKNITVSGLQWSDYRDRTPGWVARVQSEIFRLYSDGKLRPHISRTFKLADFANALIALRNSQAEGKIILTTAS